jgi:hypothetical protein
VCLSDARRAAVAFVQDDTMVERLRLPFSVAENVMNGAHIEQLAAGLPNVPSNAQAGS